MSNLEPRILELVGRLHVLLVHFPIALILTAGFVELVGRGRSRPGARGTARWCLGLGAGAALATAATGWIDADHVTVGRALSGTLLLHRCLGIATALAACATWTLSRPARGPRSPRAESADPAGHAGGGYRSGLFVSCALVALTGHFGGTLVHGSGYLLGPLFEEQRAPGAAAENGAGTPSPADAGPDFAREVEPILAARCYGCHGARRQKGRLRLDRLHELFARPAQDVIVAKDPAASELVRRIGLAEDDEDVMPAEGERLSDGQIDVLRRWIAAGAKLPDESGTSAPGVPGAPGSDP